MSGRLAGRVAVVTGGGDGIGRGVCERFVAEGANVVIAERDAEAGQAVADRLGDSVHLVVTDVARREDNEAMVAAAIDRWGRIDILVNNAWGGGVISRFESKTENDFARAMAVGFNGPVWAMQAAFPHLKSQGGGNIVNVCSLNGVNAHIGTAEYNTAKEALRAATRTAAREWAPHKIVVNAICPAAKSAAFRRAMAAHPELEAAADASNPMGRIGDPYDDIAPVVVFLASDDARYVTGNTLFVDGGGHINGVAWAPDLPDDDRPSP